jgi:diguanylate cyclase (GGDEF)-like protein/PAS domain S-box-containing protein
VLAQFAQLASLAIDNAALYQAAQSELEERRRAETELRRRNGYLAALQATTLALIGSEEPEELIATVLRDATALFGASSSYVALLQPDSETMVVRAAVGTDVYTIGKPLVAGRGIGGHVWASGASFFTNAYRDWAGRVHKQADAETVAAAGVPLTASGQVVGVLALAYDNAGTTVDDTVLPMLEQFGRLASLALQNTRLHAAATQELTERRRAEEALTRRNGYLAALHGTTLALTDQRDLSGTLETIVTRVRALLDTDHAFLELVEPDERGDALIGAIGAGIFASTTGNGVRSGEGLDGSVWQNGLPIVVDDYLRWPGRRRGGIYEQLQSVAAVPLKLGARVVGVLGLARLRGEAGFSIEEVEALVQFGQLAAVAVENARLHDETRRAQAGLQRQLDFTAAIADNLGEGIIALDCEQRITRLNPAAAALLGWQERDLLDQPVWQVLTRDEAAGRRLPASLARLDGLLRAEQPFRIDDALFTRRDGLPLAVDYSASPIVSGGERQGTVIAFHDITERKQQTAALEHQALHDALTGLPNRVLLQDRLDQAVRAATRAGEPLALLVMDLDGFKEVNDTLGHQAGDALLQQVAIRLAGVLRDSDTVARLGGDEFAVLLPGVGASGARLTARKLLRAIEKTAAVDDHAIDVGASLGIALFPEHGDEPDALLRRADVAMYVAKRSRSGIELYAPEHDKHTPDRLAMLADLRGAIDTGQFVLYYQPVVRFADQRVVRAEALLRWQHPRLGLLPPDTFIPLAEDTSLITPLTRWVLAQALRQCAAWQAAGAPLGVAVNLSPRVLHEADLPQLLRTLLAQYDLPPAAVTLEITESALIAYPQQALDVLTQLHEMGLRLAIDDFGTGYSSLAYVKQLPIDEIKIDKSFVIDMRTGESDAAIVRSTIDLAHNLGLQTVAEGIEDAEAWQQLDALGCDEGQGYYFTRPIPADAFDSWLAARG